MPGENRLITAEVPAGRPAEHRPSEVIYQVYPASFADSNGDGTGDLRGIKDHLGHIKSLNVDAVWISPVFLSPPGPEGDGGYAVTDYRQIDPKYGTLAEFQALLDEAHKLELRVYMDFVVAHTSSDHEWFQKSVRREPLYDDYYVWHDGGRDENGSRIPPNNWKSVFGGPAWSFCEDRGQWYLHHFLPSQPALNHNLEKVQKAVLQEMQFWLDLGVDGFRLDALPFANYDPEFRNNDWLDGQWPRHEERWEDQYFAYSICQTQTVDFVRLIRTLMDSYPEKKTTLGEVISGPEGGRNGVPTASSYVDRFEGLDMCYTDALIGFFNYPDRARIAGMITYIEDHFPDGGNCNAASNHDFPRAATRVTNGIPPEHQATVQRQLMRLFACLPGSFCMYQGEELGLPQARLGRDIPFEKIRDPVFHTKGMDHCRDGARTPMPWRSCEKNAGFSASDHPYLPVPKTHVSLAVDRQECDPHSMLQFTRHLLNWRREQPALVKGRTAVLPTDTPVLGIVRMCEDQTLLCLFNLSGKKQKITPSDYLDDDLLDRLSLHKGETLTLFAYDSKICGNEPKIAVPEEKAACACTGATHQVSRDCHL